MKRLKFMMLAFCLALSVPLGWFVHQTNQGLEQEEAAELRFFADTLFIDMEEALAEWVKKEESRAIDEYNYYYNPDPEGPATGFTRSPLSHTPKEQYLLGYFQNNPDGSFQSPLMDATRLTAPETLKVVEQLRNLNDKFNSKRTETPELAKTHIPDPFAVFGKNGIVIQEEKQVGLFGKYLVRSKKQKVRMGQEMRRVEEITVFQAGNVLRTDPMPQAKDKSDANAPESESDTAPDKKTEALSENHADAKRRQNPAESVKTASKTQIRVAESISDTPRLQVEVDPMQSVFVDDQRIYMFRRVVFHNNIYRQGVVIEAEKFLKFLLDDYFSGQPMSGFARLSLKVADRNKENAGVHAGPVSQHPKFVLKRVFPRPFSFLTAELTCDALPRSSGREIINVMITALVAAVFFGLLAIYQSARTVLDMSERRTKFVSSVTHELKTPLTNIRMYIEMLEQGIARNPDREQEYFRILGSESARLSRLINNVLEFSRIEKKQISLNMQPGDFTDVVREVSGVMGEKLRQEEFVLNIAHDPVSDFEYDREVMIQVLINLMENSMKFGKNSPEKSITLSITQDRGKTLISVSDSGPGIPKHALKKVFDDFYRVESSVVGHARGTGIGLAFVKKFVAAMGGSVHAKNNNGPGCAITISLPS